MPQDDFKTLFVEVEDWESDFLRSHCKDHCDFETTGDTVQDLSLDRYEDVACLSPFIHSQVTEEVLDGLPNLRLITTRSTGVDHIATDACRERDITVCNVPTYGANTVAEHTFALLLALTRRVHKAYEQTIRGRFSIEGLRGIDLRDRTLGVVGTGSIGTHVIRIALGFQMRVLAFDVAPVAAMADALGFRYVDLETLLAESDIVTLHCPLTDENAHMIDGEAIDRMKDDAILINTARGGLVDTDALVHALRSGGLGGAGLDVLEEETAIREEGEMLSRQYDTEQLQTLVQNTILLRMDNVIVTPHIGFNSQEAVHKILDTTIHNISSFLSRQPRNVVVGPAANEGA
jgi:D-lactate dehydrogenase